MIVIFIAGTLVAAAIAITRGRIESAKWSEANSTAGIIRRAIRTFVAENGSDYDYKKLEGKLDKPPIYRVLGFSSSGLSGAYFNQGDYILKRITADPPSCVVEVKSSHAQGPSGKGRLAADGSWSVN
jgi:hypothetical protein